MLEYKFVGVVNLFNLYPDFLFPVYEKDNELYFHNGSIDRIEDFDPLSDSVKNKVIFLDDKDYHILNFLETANYSIDSSPVYAFQESEKVIFCSDPSYMFSFFINYNTDDDILEENIDLFKQEYSSSYIEKTQSETNSFVESVKRSITENELPIYFADGLKNNFLPYYTKFDNHKKLKQIIMDMHSQRSIENVIQIKHLVQNYHGINATTIFAHSLGAFVTAYPDFNRPFWHKLFQYELKTKPMFVGVNMSDNYTFSACYPAKNYLVSDLKEKYLQNKVTDFLRMRLSFDNIIKQLPPMSDFYGICIECQNSVINKDEVHLLQTINRHLLMFQAMQRKKLLDDYLVEYIQNHTNETDYIIIDEIKNTQN